MKKFTATLVQIEHKVITVICKANTEEEAYEKFSNILEDADFSKDGECVRCDYDVIDIEEIE